MKRVLIISLLLLLATFFYRLPALVNSEEINSDGAIVGLQAMHMLHGEWSWTLWGANYQSSIDSAMTAIAFAIFGVSPLVLMLVPVFGHLIVTFLALRVIARRSNLMVAAIAVLPLVITPWAVSSVVTIPPRQWCITIVFIAVWLLDGASESKRPMLRYALGGLMAPLAIFADVYAILFVPGLAAFGLMCLLDGKPDRRLLIRRTLACGAGGLIAAIIVFVGRLSHPGTVPLPTLTLDRIAINADLFWNWCLPFALGYKLVPHEFHAQFVLNRLAMPWYALQIFGGWSLIVGIVLGGTFLVRKMPWKLSRLGLFGLFTAVSATVMFHLSSSPIDPQAVRYLGPIFWMAPFALAPLGLWLGAKRFAIAIIPYLIVAAFGGWNSYTQRVNGLLPRRTVTKLYDQEMKLGEALRKNGIHYGVSEFWLAYHLTFLWHEDPLIAVSEPRQDRYPPYRERVDAQRYVAIICHPELSRQSAETTEKLLNDVHASYARLVVGEFTALVVDRASVPATTQPSPPAPTTQASQ